ncbi:demethoxyubiquinone hydroxylase family protein [Hyphobacterium sp.]|uniref:demethoxyubiquinone hydroxylase family protein n=1 Tax=Hyphobacterium sp. TaxID=2004662 RepID=UPI003B515F35
MSRGDRPALPGKRLSEDRIAEMIRVDHAGEYGAVAIYEGQLAVFGKIPSKTHIANQLRHMAEDEQAHLDAFDDYIRTRGVRPTALMPLWKIAGRTLGVATALMGEKAAHACTEAVETVIEGHYTDQIAELENAGEDALSTRFTQFRDEEVAHKDLAVEEGAKDAFGYPVLSRVIEAGCRAAIAVTSKV